MKRLLLAMCLLVSACGGAPTAASPSSSSAEARSTTGTITEVRDEGRVLVIAHEELPGYMRAMTMPFEVEANARDGSLQKGDAITFTFVDQEGKRVITKLARKK